MKKIFLYIAIFVSGFITHKALNYVYDYSFNTHFDGPVCSDIMFKGGNLSARFACTYKQMGFFDNLKYILIRPTAKNGLDQDDWTF